MRSFPIPACNYYLRWTFINVGQCSLYYRRLKTTRPLIIYFVFVNIFTIQVLSNILSLPPPPPPPPPASHSPSKELDTHIRVITSVHVCIQVCVCFDFGHLRNTYWIFLYMKRFPVPAYNYYSRWTIIRMRQCILCYRRLRIIHPLIKYYVNHFHNISTAPHLLATHPRPFTPHPPFEDRWQSI